jgi:hypothetical protein
MWQVFEWKYIISTSNSWIKEDLPHEKEYLKGFSFARLALTRQEDSDIRS